MTDANGEGINLIAKLQSLIASKLDDLGYADGESAGDIMHHLAEVAVLGHKLFEISIPLLLSLPPERSSQLGDLAVDIQHDLWEMKEAIDDMEPHLVKLVNFLNP
jgi:hypothetical protein